MLWSFSQCVCSPRPRCPALRKLTPPSERGNSIVSLRQRGGESGFLSILSRRKDTLEGVLREYGLNDRGEFEDEYRYTLLRRDWLELYDKSRVEVIV